MVDGIIHRNSATGATMKAVVSLKELHEMVGGCALERIIGGKRRLIYHGTDKEYHYMNFLKDGTIGFGHYHLTVVVVMVK